MKILRLQTQGFKRIVAVDVTPDGSVVNVRGDNAEGKTSLLDSIMAALGGGDAAPLKPIRTGDDFAAIRVELGDGEPALIVEKYFDEVGEKLRVTNAEGAEFTKGQTTVDKMLGRMTFDPLAFARLKPAEQAAELLRLVPLSVDLDALAKADAADKLARRDVNREGKNAVARRDAVNVSGIIPPKPDREAIVAALAGAGEVNAGIERERADRDDTRRVITGRRDHADGLRTRANELRAEADRLDKAADADLADATRLQGELDALPPLAEPVDTAALSADLAKADADLALLARVEERKRLDDEVEALRARSEAFTTALADRAKLRADALAAAEMPVEGLKLARLCDVVPGETAEDLIAVYEGEPFSQASSAQQLRVSMRLAMAANPKLRVMLIRDGSLLDRKAVELVREMAGAEQYQVWIESVGEGDGTGLIMEAGTVRGAPEPERLDPPKRRKARAEEPVDQLTAAGVQHALPPVEANKLAGFIADELAAEKPAPAPAPARRKPSEMRAAPKAPRTDLFGGDA